MQLKTNSGRNRLNILGAYSPDERDLISLSGRESCDGERVAQLLHKIRAANPGKRSLIVLDNAPYNHADPVSEAAKRLRIELLYLPTYSPNLNLIERFWKFVKKTCLYSKYYSDHLSFQQAIIECIEQAPHRHKDELASLLTLKFQSFKEVPVIGEASNVCLFPVARQTKIKVSSKAA